MKVCGYFLKRTHAELLENTDGQKSTCVAENELCIACFQW